MPAGRPSGYTPELADEICKRIAAPMSLTKVCKAADMPGMSSVFEWLRQYPEFKESYAHATAERAEAQGEEMLDIAEDKTIEPKRARLMIDTRKWLMSKTNPKKYGDRVTTELTGADGGPLRKITAIEIKAVDP